MLTLVVEDDPDYADIIAHTLKRDHHEVVTIDNIAGAMSFATKKPPALAIVDVLLPDGSGLDLCQDLRATLPQLPIIILTSLDRSSDMLAGFNSGADDYIAKPFHPAELLARAQALLRRTQTDDRPRRAIGGRLDCNGLAIDLETQTAVLDGVDLDCTPIEVEILAQLARYPGQALSHGFLTEQVWGYKNVKDATLLKGHVSSIRRKLKIAGGDEDAIRTVHGVGYSFTPL